MNSPVIKELHAGIITSHIIMVSCYKERRNFQTLHGLLVPKQTGSPGRHSKYGLYSVINCALVFSITRLSDRQMSSWHTPGKINTTFTVTGTCHVYYPIPPHRISS